MEDGVASLGEIVLPGDAEELGVVTLGDCGGGVGGAGVADGDDVDEVADGVEAAR